MGTFVHNDSNGGNVTSITAVTWGTAGAAAQSGDLAIMPWVFLNTETPTDPTSEAWSLAVSNVSQDCEGRILYRICDGTESGDITGWSTTGVGNRQAAVLYVCRGYDFISGFKVFNETTNSTTHDCPTLTTADGFGGNTPADGDTTLVFVFDRAASTTASPPSGWATRSVSVFAATGTGGTIVGMADDSLTDSSTFPVDPGAWSGLVSSDDAFTVTMSLRPTSSGASHSATGDRAATATLAGAATAEKPASGNRSATATLTGDATGAKSASGDRTVTSTLSGAASLAKSAVGTLAAVAALTGAATGLKSSAGDLAATVTATGAASVVKSAAGTMTTSVALTGAAEVVGGLSATGDRAVTADLSGGALVERQATGNRTATVSLAGAGEVTRNASGDLSATVVLAGAARLEHAASGDLPLTAALTGEAAVFAAYIPADEVTATVRSLTSSAVARDPEPIATPRSYVSTATARSPE